MYPLQPFIQAKRRLSRRNSRYECQFRANGGDEYSTDCAFNDLDLAMSFVSLVVRFSSQVEAGKVFDGKTRQVVFICHTPVVESQTHQAREAPAEYAQLAMTGFDSITQKATSKRKKKVNETLARLRQLHDELNAQLYTHPTERPSIHSPSDAAGILEYFIGGLDHEELWVINLDTRNRVMQLVQLYKGSVNSSQVRIAEVFRQAIVDNAPAIIVAHNHPSGEPSPSPDDVAVTKAILQAGKMLDIELLDHLVISTGGKYVSLKERGLGFS